MTMRLLLSLPALFSLSWTVVAQTRPLPQGEIRAHGDIRFGNALKLGKRDGNKTVINPDTPQILGLSSTSDASMMSVAPPIKGARSRTLAVRARERLSVADFPGADPTGATSSQAAFDAACSAAKDGEQILIPPGAWDEGDPTCTKAIRWLASGATSVPVDSPFTKLPGIVEYGLGGHSITWMQKTRGNDLSVIDVRREAKHTGGSPGWAASAMRASTSVGPNVTNFEWTGLFIMDNSAGSGENVGLYVRSNKRSTGHTFGILSEVYDYSGANPTTPIVAQEIDINANGGDANRARYGTDYVLRREKRDRSEITEAETAIRWQGEPGFHRWRNLMRTYSNTVATHGLNTTQGAIQGSVILMAAEQRISFEPSQQFALSFNIANAALTAQNRFRIAGLPIRSGAGVGDTPLSIGANTGNDDTLKFQVVRQASGSDWTSAIWRIVRKVDGVAVSPTLDFGSGSVAVTSGVLKLPAYTVTTLPTCNDTNRDGTAIATDLTTASSTAFRGSPVGGGSVRGPVYCDGIAWTVH